MEVIDALQHVHRLVDVATVVVVGELLDTADDIALSSEVLDLVLQACCEDATHVLAVQAGGFALDAVTLDVVVDSVVRDEELLATALSRFASLPQVTEDLDRVHDETRSEHTTDAVFAEDLLSRRDLAHRSLRQVHIAVGGEEGHASDVVLVLPDPVADGIPLVVGHVDGVRYIILDGRLHVAHAGDDPALLDELDVLKELDATEFAAQKSVFAFFDGEEDLLVRSGLEDVGLYSLGVSLFVSLEVGLFDVGLDATQVALSVSAVDTRGHTEQEAYRTIRLDAGRAAGGVDAEDASALRVLLAHLHSPDGEDILVREDLRVVHDPADGYTDEGIGLDDVRRSLSEVREVHVGSLHGSERRRAAADLVELLFARTFHPVDGGKVTYLPARIAILIRGEEADFAAGVTADTEFISPVETGVTARAHRLEERIIE